MYTKYLNFSLATYLITSVSILILGEVICSGFNQGLIEGSCFFFQSGYAIHALCTHLINFGANDVDSLLITQVGKRPFGLLWVTYPISHPLFDRRGAMRKPKMREISYEHETVIIYLVLKWWLNLY